MNAVLERERRGSILVLRLNRPEARNALNTELMQAIGSAILDAEREPDIRVVVLTGAGDRAFCAGLDLRAFSEGAARATGEEAEAFGRLVLGTVTIPVVGAANGTAVGGGLELLLGCDMVVASAAARFGLPEVKRGLFPGGDGMMLGTRIPLAVALEMALTGDPIDAARAYELGLVNAVVPPDEVFKAAVGLAERVAANGPLGVAAVKELVRLAAVDVAAARERKAHWQPVVYTSEDAKEGARAFVEKRPPVWRGR